MVRAVFTSAPRCRGGEEVGRLVAIIGIPKGKQVTRNIGHDFVKSYFLRDLRLQFFFSYFFITFFILITELLSVNVVLVGLRDTCLVQRIWTLLRLFLG